MECRQLCVDDQILMKEIDEGEVVNIFNAIDAERDYLSEWLPFVEKTVDILRTELIRTMSLIGASSIADLDSTCLHDTTLRP